MKIVVLMEDLPGQKPVCAEHGLSFYIETASHKLLMDAGASEKTAENSALLGVDLSKVDTVILSHGHYDHTGGLPAIAKLAPAAEIYLQKAACAAFYHADKYIGIDRQILDLPHLHLLEAPFVQLDGELSLFTVPDRRHPLPPGSGELYCSTDGQLLPDGFAHEHSLAVCENGKRFLFSGCAHSGILNILDRFRTLYRAAPDAVLSGFHLPHAETAADRFAVVQIAQELVRFPSVYYTGHCTGQAAFELMRPVLGAQLRRLHAGDELIF